MRNSCLTTFLRNDPSPFSLGSLVGCADSGAAEVLTEEVVLEVGMLLPILELAEAPELDEVEGFDGVDELDELDEDPELMS